jgi:phosphinothricin acetyltransferase
LAAPACLHPVRLAAAADLPRLVEIYNQAIAAGDVTADTVPFAVEARRDWFEQHGPAAYPIYVCGGEPGKVLGYLSLSPYRGRPALARTAEVSYYVDYEEHGRGIGSALLAHALREAPGLGKRVLIAVLLEWNTASLGLLVRFGFERWGYLPGVAELGGRLCGQFYYGRKV